MDIRLTDLIPKKIVTPRSLEDVGWNACCNMFLENIELYEQLYSMQKAKENSALCQC